MTFWKYVKDQRLILCAWFVCLSLMVMFLWLTPSYPFHWSIVGYLCVLQTLLLLFFLVLHYFLKRRWWRKLTFKEGDDLLQQRLANARNSDELLQQTYINRLLQEHRFEMQEMLRQQTERKDYIDSWVHEIKVPLAASQLLLRSIEFDISDAKYMALENEWNKMNDYVEQVLYVARLDNFTQDYFIKETSLLQTVQPVIRSQANYFIEKNIRFNIIGEDQEVLTDGKWVAFIFRQLLSNAIKYTPSGGSITVTVTKDEAGVRLAMRDTGVGIAPAEQRRIFEKGFTGSNGRNNEVHSTGLGLYLAKNLTAQLGVELTVESTINEGTTMTMFFPMLSFFQLER